MKIVLFSSIDVFDTNNNCTFINIMKILFIVVDFWGVSKADGITNCRF